MKFQRKNILRALAGIGLVATLVFGGAVSAEPGQGGKARVGQHHGQRIEKLKSELGLSEEQSARIKAIMEANRTEMKQLHEQMRGVFTADQQAQMKSWRENRKAGERPNREDRKSKWEALGVTDAQKEQLKTYREQMKTKRESVKSQIAGVLTPEQQTKWEAKKAEFRGKHGKRGHRGDAPK